MFIHLLLLLALSLLVNLEGLVVGVHDGDTITILVESHATRIRLYGIDCPEKGQDFAEVAKKRVSFLCFQSLVTVEVKGKDGFGRILGNVLLEDGRILNCVLIEEGLAWWYRKFSPRDEQLKKLEAEARRAMRGIWSISDPIPPWEYRKLSKKKGG